MAARRQVAIIGEAPAGLPLSHMLHRDGIDSILLERQSRIHVMERIRAGVPGGRHGRAPARSRIGCADGLRGASP